MSRQLRSFWTNWVLLCLFLSVIRIIFLPSTVLKISLTRWFTISHYDNRDRYLHPITLSRSLWPFSSDFLSAFLLPICLYKVYLQLFCILAFFLGRLVWTRTLFFIFILSQRVNCLWKERSLKKSGFSSMMLDLPSAKSCFYSFRDRVFICQN